MTVHEELEDFELAVEQLEEAARLARIDSPLKCRRALILLDNLAEILTYRFCQERYREDFAFVQAFPPKLRQSRWRRVIVKCCGSAGHDQAASLGWLSLE